MTSSRLRKKRPELPSYNHHCQSLQSQCWRMHCKTPNLMQEKLFLCCGSFSLRHLMSSVISNGAGSTSAPVAAMVGATQNAVPPHLPLQETTLILPKDDGMHMRRAESTNIRGAASTAVKSGKTNTRSTKKRRGASNVGTHLRHKKTTSIQASMGDHLSLAALVSFVRRTTHPRGPSLQPGLQKSSASTLRHYHGGPHHSYNSAPENLYLH